MPDIILQNLKRFAAVCGLKNGILILQQLAQICPHLGIVIHNKHRMPPAGAFFLIAGIPDRERCISGRRFRHCIHTYCIGMNHRNRQYEHIRLGYRIHDQRTAMQLRQRPRQGQTDSASGHSLKTFLIAKTDKCLENRLSFRRRHNISVIIGNDS